MSRLAMAIAARGPVMAASRPDRAVRAEMAALLMTDQADRVRAIRSVSVWSSRQVANTGLNTPTQVSVDTVTAVGDMQLSGVEPGRSGSGGLFSTYATPVTSASCRAPGTGLVTAPM
jgi:hypothetical protein